MRTWILLSTFALALPLAACGDDTGGAGGSGSGSGGAAATSTDTASSGTTSSTGTGTGAAVEDVDCAGATVAATITTEASTAFVPAATTIAAGSVVKFDPGGGSHDMTSDDAGVFSTETGAVACLKFNTPGDYAFHCSVHAPMVGTVTVN